MQPLILDKLPLNCKRDSLPYRQLHIIDISIVSHYCRNLWEPYLNYVEKSKGGKKNNEWKRTESTRMQ